MKNLLLIATMIALASCSSDDGGTAGGVGELPVIGLDNVEVETVKIDVPEINIEPLPELEPMEPINIEPIDIPAFDFNPDDYKYKG